MKAKLMNCTLISSGGGNLEDKLASRDDGKQWFCTANVYSPNDIIHSKYTQKIYNISSYRTLYHHKVLYTVVLYYAPYIYPALGTPKNSHSTTISDKASTRSITCFDLYDCFYQMYESDLIKAQHCGKIDFPSIDSFEYYTEKYFLGSHKYIWHFATSDIHGYVSTCYLAYYVFHSSYYECNVEDFVPFYRNENINNMNFNSYVDVSEYIVYETYKVIYFYSANSKVSSNWRQYIIAYAYGIDQTDHFGRMYIHMTCFR